jgi:hypothetical protein
MDAVEKITNLIGIDAIKKEAKGWKILAANPHLENQHVSLNYLIPLESGAGRSTVTEAMTNALRELRLFDFESAVPFIEVKLDDKAGQARRIFELIRSGAIITNEFRGVVSVDISAFTENLRDAEFSEFLDMVKENNANIVFLFFTQRLSAERITKVLSKLQTSGNTKLLQSEDIAEKELLIFALYVLERDNIAVEHKGFSALLKMIGNIRENADFAYYKSICKLVSDIMYYVSTDHESGFSKTGIITHDDLVGYSDISFSRHILIDNDVRKLGF